MLIPEACTLKYPTASNICVNGRIILPSKEGSFSTFIVAPTIQTSHIFYIFKHPIYFMWEPLWKWKRNTDASLRFFLCLAQKNLGQKLLLKWAKHHRSQILFATNVYFWVPSYGYFLIFINFLSFLYYFLEIKHWPYTMLIFICFLHTSLIGVLFTSGLLV